MKFCLTVLLLIGAVFFGAPIAGRVTEAVRVVDKMSVAEIVSKHLESIGPASSRTPAGGRVIGGTTQVTFRSRGIAQTNGGAVLASDGTKSMVTMKFDSSQYPYEKIGFDGSKVTSYQLPGAAYSNLGSFARANPAMFKEGLVGGVLSSAWPLLDLSARKVKLEYAGTKKVNSRELVEVRYVPRGGSDLKISLFFDPETFQHVRTTYKKEMSAQMSRGGLGSTQTGVDRTGEGSAGQSNTTYELVEEFSDFKIEGGMTLPHIYKIHLAQQGSATQISDWVMTLVTFAFNQLLESKDFDVSSD